MTSTYIIMNYYFNQNILHSQVYQNCVFRAHYGVTFIYLKDIFEINIYKNTIVRASKHRHLQGLICQKMSVPTPETFEFTTTVEMYMNLFLYFLSKVRIFKLRKSFFFWHFKVLSNSNRAWIRAFFSHRWSDLHSA